MSYDDNNLMEDGGLRSNNDDDMNFDLEEPLDNHTFEDDDAEADPDRDH